MKYVDVAKLFEGKPSQIALLSTFQFDPDFFERRLLRCSALANARRIVVFMDHAQWRDLVAQQTYARGLNRRYLVVPVHRPTGVFHPKLSLLLSEKDGQVLCGSNNLTSSGCARNLELINAIPFQFDNGEEQRVSLASDTFAFFRRAASDADREIGRLVGNWLDETERDFPWLAQQTSSREAARMRLVTTYETGMWEVLLGALEGKKPRRLVVLSPFHDGKGELLRRARNAWPRCKIEILVQQDYTNLQVGPTKAIRPPPEIWQVENETRRVHAKLIAWETSHGVTCLVGSANFTSAAFDGRNVETCLLLKDSGELVSALFDDDLKKRRIELTDFEPGSTENTDECESDPPALEILAAVLTPSNHLKLTYRHPSGWNATTRLELRIHGLHEKLPRRVAKIDAGASSADLDLSEASLEAGAAPLLASLHAELEGSEWMSSHAVWIIDEKRLTRESGSGPSSTKQKVEETGDGLVEFLDGIATREGESGLVDYLPNLNIRFYDGGSGLRDKRPFSIKIRDPYRPDLAPQWLLDRPGDHTDLATVVVDFVARHRERKLRKHARRGNPNGIQNFVDIFTTMIRILFVYFRRKVITEGAFISEMKGLIYTAAGGDGAAGGYLEALSHNLRGSRSLLGEVCDESNFLAELEAGLLMAQLVRYKPGETPRYGSPPRGPRDVLPKWVDNVESAIAGVGLAEPKAGAVRSALERYPMLRAKKIFRLIKEYELRKSERVASSGRE